MAHDAALVFEGVPLKVEVTHHIGDVWFTKVQFRMDRRLKGPLSDGDIVTIWDIEGKDQMDFTGAMVAKRKVLIFAKMAPENIFPALYGRFMFYHHFWNRTGFYTDEPVKWIYAEAGTAIRNYGPLLTAVETQIAKEEELVGRYWSGTIIRRDIVAPDGSEAESDLYAASAVFLISIEYKPK